MGVLDYIYDSCITAGPLEPEKSSTSPIKMQTIEINLNLPAARIVRIMEHLEEITGLPQKAIRLDNGGEQHPAIFINWCEEREIELKFIQLSKPKQNPYIEQITQC